MHSITPASTWQINDIEVPDGPDAIDPLHLENPVQMLANSVLYLNGVTQGLEVEKLRSNHKIELITRAPLHVDRFRLEELEGYFSQTEAPVTGFCNLVWGVPFPQLPPTDEDDIIGQITSVAIHLQANPTHSSLPEILPGATFYRRKGATTAEEVGYVEATPSTVAEYENAAGFWITVPLDSTLRRTTRGHSFFLRVTGEAGASAEIDLRILSVTIQWSPL